MQETQEIRVQSLGREDPLEKEMATHSSVLAWRIPRTEEPGGLQSMGSQWVRHDWGIEREHTLRICYSALIPPEVNLGKNSVNKRRNLPPPREGSSLWPRTPLTLLETPIRSLPRVPAWPLWSCALVWARSLKSSPSQNVILHPGPPGPWSGDLWCL